MIPTGWSSSTVRREPPPVRGHAERDRHEHGPKPWPLSARGTAADGLSAWAPQDQDAGRRVAQVRHGRALAIVARTNGAPMTTPRRVDQRRLVRSLCAPCVDPDAAPWRCGHHGQPLEPQTGVRSRDDRGSRCEAPVPSTLQPGLQPVYGWLLRGKGFVSLLLLVGCGHVCGVSMQRRCCAP